MRTLLLILISASCFAQTHLPLLGQNFAANEHVAGYTMRGLDINKLHHENIDVLMNVNDGSTYTSITPTYFNPSIGTTLTSQSYDLMNFTINQITWYGTPTVSTNPDCITLNGTTQWATVPYSTTYFPSGSGAFTMSIAFKFSSNTSAEFFSIGSNVGSNPRLGFYYPGSGLLGAEWGGSGRAFVWIYNTNWNVLTISYAGGSTSTNLLFYLNGVVQTTTVFAGSDQTLNLGSANVAIGTIAGALGAAPFFGSLALPFVIKSVLTSTQVTSLYNAYVNAGY